MGAKTFIPRGVGNASGVLSAGQRVGVEAGGGGGCGGGGGGGAVVGGAPRLSLGGAVGEGRWVDGWRGRAQGKRWRGIGGAPAGGRGTGLPWVRRGAGRVGAFAAAAGAG